METIIQLDERHCNELGRLNRLLIEDEGHSNPLSPDELAERMRKWLAGDYRCHGIVGGDKILAYCLHRDDGDYYYLRQLFTDRSCRQSGQASRLLAHLESEVLSDKPIRLEVLVNNEEAIRFYDKRGYRVYCHTLVKDASKCRSDSF